MAIPIQMPQPGNTVEECLLVSWTRKKGERVSAGEVIAEIETDKAAFEVEAPADGVLLETFFEEGALVPVFTNICVVGEPGEDVEGFRPSPVTAPAPERRPEPTAREAAPEPPPAAPAGGATVLSPRARQFAAEHDFFPEVVSGSGPGGRVLEADLRDLYERSPRVSPLAREMMKEGYRARGAGSGINQMIVSRDLSEPPVRLSRLRQTIARRMRESLAGAAQYTLHASADATGLLRLRAALKAAGEPVNINDLVTYCTVVTLKEMPELNAELIGGELYRHAEIHLGFACDTPRGLVVPVIRNCHDLSLRELAARIHTLSEEAARGTLSPDDMTGATFTLSNLGSLGVESFTPILNPPQVAILGVNAIQLKPVRRDDGRVEFVEHIGLSLTCDHQVIDGAPGARFLQKLRENIQKVEQLAAADSEEK